MFKLQGFVYHSGLLCATGLGGVFVGIYLGKKDSTMDNIEKLKNLPGFPLLSTVSAATVISENKVDTYSYGDSLATRTSQIMKYGFPGLENVKSYDDFVLSYDQRNRVPHWVFEHLTKNTIQPNSKINRSKCEFKEDTSIHPFFRSTNHDYKGSGYDRGHLAAAGNHRICQKHVDQTFFLSNISPQVGVGFNRDIWNKLEKYIRHLVRKNENVYVCTGPLYLPLRENDGKLYVKYEVIGSNHVSVPTHFFKIAVIETKSGEFEMECFVMPNKPIDDKTNLSVFQVPPETIERASGLLFFNRLSKDKLAKINGRAVIKK